MEMIHRKKNIIHITLSPLKMFPSVLLFIALKTVKIGQKNGNKRFVQLLFLLAICRVLRACLSHVATDASVKPL